MRSQLHLTSWAERSTSMLSAGRTPRGASKGAHNCPWRPGAINEKANFMVAHKVVLAAIRAEDQKARKAKSGYWIEGRWERQDGNWSGSYRALSLNLLLAHVASRN
jgi:hypothetical protein